MYDYIKGKLTKITAKYIVIEAGGLGYIVNVLIQLIHLQLYWLFDWQKDFGFDESRYPSLPSSSNS